jgi:anti-sigma regulatory factor (Ser/Thr protein kinase)
MNSSQKGDQLSWNYPATIKNVEQVCSAVTQILKKYSLHKKDRFAIELLLREALNNAVLHGCDQNPLLSFSCQLKMSVQKAVIEVSNEGVGFDWRGKLESLPSNVKESGRGLSIYAIYADSINFNEAGNCVSLTRIFNKGENDD